MRRGALGLVALAAACTFNGSAAPWVEPSLPPLRLAATANPPPRDDGTVQRSAQLVLTLDSYPDPDAVAYGPISLRSGRGNFDIALAVDLVGRSIVVTPRTLLEPDTQYELVASGLASLDGRRQTTPASFAFHAGSDAGTPPPTPPPPTWYGTIDSTDPNDCGSDPSCCHADGLCVTLATCAPFCHSPVGRSGRMRTPTRDLDLTRDPTDPSFGLIRVQSVGLAGTPAALERVTPGDPARSVLLRKLIGGNPQANSGNVPYPNMRVDGQRMPIDINDPDERALPPLDDDTLRRVQAWIAGGAPVRP